MLPTELHGPGKTIRFESPETFLLKNSERFPNLDPDFILQICFEHPDRFNRILPNFDPEIHLAKRVSQTVNWVYENIRYDNNEEIDFWGTQFDAYLDEGGSHYEVFTHMIEKQTWPFPPVIIEAGFARELGAKQNIGKPYYLVEGTHRVSYLRRMLERGMVKSEKSVELIQISAS